MATNQIKVGAIISYIALFVNVLIGLLYTPWLINTIGKSDYGLYTLAVSLSNCGAIPPSASNEYFLN